MTVTVNSFRMKFDELASQPDWAIQLVLEEAARRVDSTWGNDQDLGTLYWAAHFLMLEIQREASATGQIVASERFGPMSVTYQAVVLPTQDKTSDLTLTMYGLRVLDLLKLNFPAVIVI